MATNKYWNSLFQQFNHMSDQDFAHFVNEADNHSDIPFPIADTDIDPIPAPSLLTPFGYFLRSLRFANAELLLDMSNKLQCSPSTLSAVETGRKPIPPDWVAKIIAHYSLTQEQIEIMDKLKTKGAAL